jgi:hypothetical protein
MGNLGPGIAPLPVEKEPSHADSRITQRRQSPPSTGWSRSPGTGGRDQSERLVAINRNSWSQSSGARKVYEADPLQYLVINLGVAFAAFVGIFGLAMVIPAIVLRYWGWLKT